MATNAACMWEPQKCGGNTVAAYSQQANKQCIFGDVLKPTCAAAVGAQHKLRCLRAVCKVVLAPALLQQTSELHKCMYSQTHTYMNTHITAMLGTAGCVYNSQATQ